MSRHTLFSVFFLFVFMLLSRDDARHYQVMLQDAVKGVIVSSLYRVYWAGGRGRAF